MMGQAMSWRVSQVETAPIPVLRLLSRALGLGKCVL
jgi:hypothetical protein